MPTESDKTQIGIRLPAALVRQIDANRHNKTRAEYCRELIETGLSAAGHRTDSATELIVQALVEPLQEKLAETHQSAILAERDAENAVTEIKALRQDFATAIVGVLTKIGQVVREEDQRPFAREKAEDFARRVLLSHEDESEEKP